MSLATSAIGAWLSVAATFFLLLQTRWSESLSKPKNGEWVSWGLLGAWVALSVFGTAVQVAAHRGQRHE